MKNYSKRPRTIIILLWITVLFNMIFADIFSIMIEIIDGGMIEIPEGISISIAMAVAAILTNIPILMIVLSWLLNYKWNRLLNLGAATFTIIYIVAGGSLVPHYIIMGGIEILLLLILIRVAYKWKPLN